MLIKSDWVLCYPWGEYYLFTKSSTIGGFLNKDMNLKEFVDYIKNHRKDSWILTTDPY